MRSESKGFLCGRQTKQFPPCFNGINCVILRIAIDKKNFEYSAAVQSRKTSPEKPNLMPAIKANSNVAAPSIINMEIEKKKDQIRTLASPVLEGPGQEHFLDAYL